MKEGEPPKNRIGGKFIAEKIDGNVTTTIEQFYYTQCAYCCIEKRLHTLKGCSKCKRNYYCDGQCQKAHWKLHKVYCEPCATIQRQSFQVDYHEEILTKGSTHPQNNNNVAMCVICAFMELCVADIAKNGKKKFIFLKLRTSFGKYEEQLYRKFYSVLFCLRLVCCSWNKSVLYHFGRHFNKMILRDSTNEDFQIIPFFENYISSSKIIKDVDKMEEFVRLYCLMLHRTGFKVEGREYIFITKLTTELLQHSCHVLKKYRSIDHTESYPTQLRKLDLATLKERIEYFPNDVLRYLISIGANQDLLVSEFFYFNLGFIAQKPGSTWKTPGVWISGDFPPRSKIWPTMEFLERLRVVVSDKLI